MQYFFTVILVKIHTFELCSMEYRNYELIKYIGMLQSHLDIALKNPEATQHEIEEKLLQKTKANIDSEHPDKGGLISKGTFFIWPFY